MQSEFPSLSDTRPVVVLVVLGAALTCCCLLAVAAGAVFYWVEIGTVTPAPEAVSPAGAPPGLQQHFSPVPRSPVPPEQIPTRAAAQSHGSSH